MAACLSFRDLNEFLRDLQSLYEKTGFNDEAKFGLLRNSVMEQLKLAQFAIFRDYKTHKTLFDAIMDVWSSRSTFQVAAMSFSSSGYIESESFQDIYGPKDKAGSEGVEAPQSSHLSA